MNALVLSSGLGTRLRPITYHTPKPMIEIMGLSIISFAIYPAIKNVDTFVFNLSYLSHKLHDSIFKNSN